MIQLETMWRVMRKDGSGWDLRIRKGPQTESALEAIKWCGSDPRRVAMVLAAGYVGPYWSSGWNGGKKLPLDVCVGQ